MTPALYFAWGWGEGVVQDAKFNFSLLKVDIVKKRTPIRGKKRGETDR